MTAPDARELMWPLLEALTEVAALVQRQTQHYGSDPTTTRVLARLREAGPQRPSDLASHLGLSPAAITRRVRALEAERAVVAVADEGDGRAYTVELTSDGLARLEDFANSLSTRMRERLDDWSDADIRALTSALERLAYTAPDVPDSQPRTGAVKWWRKP